MITTDLHLWTVDDYYRMIESGILTDENKVELLEGQILEMSPQYLPHAATTQRTWKYLSQQLAGKADIRIQLPITLRPKSEPEPDIAVVRFDSREYIENHPTAKDIYLLVEVADRTLSRDRTQKSHIYGKANIPEYWVVDVNKRQVYMFREPTNNGYALQTVLDENATTFLVSFPEVEVEIKQLFP